MERRQAGPSGRRSHAARTKLTPTLRSSLAEGGSALQHPTQPYPPLARCLIGYARWEVFSRRRRPSLDDDAAAFL